ncbi:hypothetical protein [Sediminitomix flava]|uniref:Uncharacterized protein n=1 Tax=Sediminitomix flava TaxID=379075 RepID=A0A315Z9M4_SEDFL|nr:hypothetical protein [Sediminitomix flava]PWJ40760.1 hypothetical protein BC781_10418 [Sediminitomix flava]
MKSKYNFVSKRTSQKKVSPISILKPDLLLHIHLLKENEMVFGSELVKSLKENFPQLTVLDVDNFSDDLLLQHVKEILRSEKNVWVVINPSEGTSFNELKFLWKELVATNGQHLLVINEQTKHEIQLPTYPNELIFQSKEVLKKLQELIENV